MALLHARHNTDPFSKFTFLDGKYKVDEMLRFAWKYPCQDYDMEDLNITNVRGYSMFMALSSHHQVLWKSQTSSQWSVDAIATESENISHPPTITIIRVSVSRRLGRDTSRITVANHSVNFATMHYLMQLMRQFYNDLNWIGLESNLSVRWTLSQAVWSQYFDISAFLCSCILVFLCSSYLIKKFIKPFLTG